MTKIYVLWREVDPYVGYSILLGLFEDYDMAENARNEYLQNTAEKNYENPVKILIFDGKLNDINYVLYRRTWSMGINDLIIRQICDSIGDLQKYYTRSKFSHDAYEIVEKNKLRYKNGDIIKLKI